MEEIKTAEGGSLIKIPIEFDDGQFLDATEKVPIEFKG